MTINFYKPRPSEVPWEELVEFNREIFRDFFPNPYGMEKYREMIKKNAPPVVILARDNKHQMVGDAISFRKDKDLYIWIMGVQKERRKQGVGSQLLHICEKEAKEWDLLSSSAKVYNISHEMQRLLIKSGYSVIEHGDKYQRFIRTLGL